MNKAVQAACVALVVGSTAHAGQRPSSFSYTFLYEGNPAGSCSTTVAQSGDRTVYNTSTEVYFESYRLELESTTEVDRASGRIVRFEYNGTDRDKQIGGETIVEGDSLKGYIMVNGSRFPATRVVTSPTVLFLESWVMTHEVLMARALEASGKRTLTGDLYVPTLSAIMNLTITKVSDSVIESEYSEATCSKLQIAMQGQGSSMFGNPFVSLYDPKRGLPVYIVFPSARAEAFLDDFFKDKPITRYRAN